MVAPEIEHIRTPVSLSDIRRHLAPGEEILLTAGTPDGYDWNSANIADIHREKPTELWTPQSILLGDMPLEQVAQTRNGISFIGSIGLFQEDIMRYLYRSGIRPVYTLSKPNDTGVIEEIGLDFVGVFDKKRVDIHQHITAINSDSLEPGLTEIVDLSSREDTYMLIPKIA
jgi:hypothetical protein